MRLWATLLVRDEVDVVAATLEHARSQGIEHVVATDNASVDGTRDVLTAYEERGFVTIIDEPNTEYRQSEWVTRMARLAAASGADWVIHLDADEFPRPLAMGSTVHGVLAALPDAVSVVQSPRRNLVRRRSDSRPWHEALVWKETLSVSERGTPIGPKVAHRADPDCVVLMGNHGVEGPRLGAADASARLEYLHVPDRSWSQYEQKIRIGGRAVESNPDFDAGIAWHWRRELERLEDGTLAASYAARQRGTIDIARAFARGRLTRSTALRDALRALRSQALEPALLEASLRAGASRDPS